MSCDNIHTCRTLPSLLASCASTVFLCTWATLHLDVPTKPSESWRGRCWRRIGWTLVALFAPEVLLFFAYEDWTTSCECLVELISEFEPL